MRSRKILILTALAVVSGMLFYHFRGLNVSKIEKAPSTNTQPMGASDSSTGFSNVISSAPLSPSDQFIESKKADPSFEWKQQINFYGRVIDQNGAPIPNGNIEYSWSNQSQNGASRGFTVSDASGHFKILGLVGKALSVWPEKDGYIRLNRPGGVGFDYADPNLPDYHRPDSNNPVVFTLFKHEKPDEFAHVKVVAPLAHDGTSTSIPLKLPRGIVVGPLVIKSRTDERTELRPMPNWSAEIELQNASICPATGPYPSLAPTEGYVNVYRRSETHGAATWDAMFEETLYFRTGEPPKYGKIKISFLTWGDSARVDCWLNEKGERTLNSGIK